MFFVSLPAGFERAVADHRWKQLFLFGIAPGQFHYIIFQVAQTHGNSDRNAFQFIFGEFPTRTCIIIVVIFHQKYPGP